MIEKLSLNDEIEDFIGEKINEIIDWINYQEQKGIVINSRETKSYPARTTRSKKHE